MEEVTRGAAARIGVDLSKRVFQVHAVGRSGRKLLAKPMLAGHAPPAALHDILEDASNELNRLARIRTKPAAAMQPPRAVDPSPAERFVPGSAAVRRKQGAQLQQGRL